MKKILLIGPAPNNIGGISIHIRRLVQLLKNEYFFDFVDEGHNRYEGIFNLRSLNILIYLHKLFKADIVHIHSGIFILRIFHIIVSKIILKKYTVVTIHRDPSVEKKNKYNKFFLKKCNHVILVNKIGYDLMKTDSESKYHLLPAFLPPIIENEPYLPIEVIEWLSISKSKNNPIVLVSNAWNLVLNKNEDLYGLDICLKAMRDLKYKDDSKNYFLLFVVVKNDSQIERMKTYKKQIREWGLSENVLIWEDSLSFIRLIKESHIVLRTTNTDGDAISIREALFYNKPVIASNVVVRPDETFLFENRNHVDLCDKIIEVSELIKGNKLLKYQKHQKNYFDIYKNIYN